MKRHRTPGLGSQCEILRPNLPTTAQCRAAIRDIDAILNDPAAIARLNRKHLMQLISRCEERIRDLERKVSLLAAGPAATHG